MRTIERGNPDTLTRVFGAADWGNREMLGDELLDPQEGESIYDPACGTGGMLLGAIEHVERAGGDERTFFGRIFGQEKNLTTSSIARMNLVLHGIEDFRIEQNDTLRTPAFTDPSGALATFDCVIANPPFSLKEWGREVWELDPWGRAAFGLPPASYGDYAWVQQMVASMAETSGRMAVVLPQGALFRDGGRRTHPAGAARAGPDRGGNRACAQHLLRHRPGPGHRDAPPHEAARAAEDRLRRVLVEDGWLE